MGLTRVLVANRGEIAVRVLRAAGELGIATAAVYSEDDAESPHYRRAGAAHALKGRGAAAYLDIEQVIDAARALECDATHPGYGFLAENPTFARACADSGIKFVGPPPGVLELLGDKTRARALAVELGVPVLSASPGPVDVAGAARFFDGLRDGEGMMIKAVAGGGGRGMRVVERREDLEAAFARCQSEARAAFGNDALYVEQLLRRARHIEIQVIGDGTALSHAGERECSVQRRHQKVIEIAPSPALDAAARERIADAAVRIAAAAGYESLGTFEFLVDAVDSARFYFIEANPRLQVEHTVTEEVTGIDLVKAQLRIAGGETLFAVGLEQAQVPPPRGFAIQARVNTERMLADGAIRPAGGTLATFQPPLGPGIRVDTYALAGYRTNPAFDSLLAKVICHSPEGFEAATRRSVAALTDFSIEGSDTNIPLLLGVLAHPDFVAGNVYTNWVEDHIAELAREPEPAPGERKQRAGAAIDKRDPLASLEYFRHGEGTRKGRGISLVPPPNTAGIPAPLQGTVTQVDVQRGELVREGQPVFVMSALKMEHVVKAGFGGLVREVLVEVGDTVMEGDALAFLEPMDVGDAIAPELAQVDLDYVRPSLATLFARREFLLDKNRPEAVHRRRSRNRRTVRENIESLIDPDTWVEYGGLTIAGQRSKRSLEELIRKTPADGLVAGIGSSTVTSSTRPVPGRCSSLTTTLSSPAPRECAAMTRPTAWWNSQTSFRCR
jgi:acetyl/propionyl-CoA carboxylase alpha subunit